MSNLQIFNFESFDVRFVGTAEVLEWVAVDIVAVLYPESDKRNYSNYLKKVPAKWKGHKKIMTLGGEQEVVTLFEAGFYHLLARSSSPIAIAFQEWLYEQVVPSIRQTGKYELKPATPATPSPQEISELYDLTLGKTDLDPKLVAGVKLNAISKLHPTLASAAELAKPALQVVVEDELLSPTQLAEMLSERTGEHWSNRKVNKLLLDQGFQQQNPDGGNNPAYLPTSSGEAYSKLILNTAKGRDKTIQSLRWLPTILEVLELGEE